jgi:hypothetical protein
MGQRSKGVGLHHRCYLRRLDGFAAAILLRPCGLVEIGLEEMTDQEDRFAGLDLDNPSPGNRDRRLYHTPRPAVSMIGSDPNQWRDCQSAAAAL